MTEYRACMLQHLIDGAEQEHLTLSQYMHETVYSVATKTQSEYYHEN